MNDESRPIEWEQVKAQLYQYRQAQRELWGDVEDMTLAKFAAGTCTDDERHQVLAAMDEYPAVRQLVHMVGSPFLPVWSIQAGVATLAEQLNVWVEGARDALSAGMADLFYEEAPTLSGALMGDSPAQPQSELLWRLPIEWDSSVGQFVISVRPIEEGSAWSLSCRVECGDDKHLAETAQLEVLNDHSDVEFAGLATDMETSPVLLNTGKYEVILTLSGRQWRIPLSLGIPP